jgi:hypothetical protein
MEVIGAGLSRTGTYSLKLALEQLGFGLCYHMSELAGRPAASRHWLAAARGEEVAWDDMFAGYRSAVDLPTSAFCTDLAWRYPKARVVLTVRDEQEWYESVQATIFADAAAAADRTHELTALMRELCARLFGGDVGDRRAVTSGYVRHNAAIRSAIPRERLLVYSVAEGWGPLCRFLGVPVPRGRFPHKNARSDFIRSLPCPTRAVAP